MKKIFAFLTITAMITMGLSNMAFAQGNAGSSESSVAASQSASADQPESSKSFHMVLKEKFIEGGAGFMAPILLCLIFGLAIAIERIIYLSLGSVNTKKLLKNLETALESGGIDEAKKVVRETPGPVASIFSEGLNRWDDGMAEVEKMVVSYGSVVTGRLEIGVSWIALFIALAPMLGFLGTVIGMVIAFDNIAAAGDISPTIVASGIKIALITTVFGLIVAIILQVFYNYIISKVESLVNEMEDSSIAFMDILAQYNKK
jgi:biopolymer transport protein ExbB